MAREAEALLRRARTPSSRRSSKLVKELLEDGYHPIVFCRFIPTAEYVADAPPRRSCKGVEVAAVTGTLPPAEREARVARARRGTRSACWSPPTA